MPGLPAARETPATRASLVEDDARPGGVHLLFDATLNVPLPRGWLR